MRKLFDELRRQLESFVEQRDDSALIVATSTREYVALCAALDGLDQGGSRHVFLIFGDPFESPAQYVAALVAAFQARYRELCQVVEQAPPPWPEDLLDATRAPVSRLQSLLMFARRLIPVDRELLLVAALVPSAIRDGKSFAQLVDELIEHDVRLPWCRNIRFVVGENAADAALSADRRRRARARYFAPNMSDESVVGALEEEANDASLPVAQRMQSLLILAGMDSAHRRTEQALEKYGLLAEYHLGMGELPRLALALSGMGEACALANRTQQARAHFERALVPAVQAKDLPSLIGISFNLARLHQGQAEWKTACDYYDGLSLLARASLNAVLQVTCNEQKGECLRQLGLYDQAFEQWQAGVSLADGMGMCDQKLSLLLRMRELAKARGRSNELGGLDHSIEELRRGGAQELPL